MRRVTTEKEPRHKRVANRFGLSNDMMKPFDYIFYRVSRYYIKRWRDDLGYYQGMGLVGLMWTFHVICLGVVAAFLWEPVNRFLFVENTGIGIIHIRNLVAALITMGLTLLRYSKLKKFETLDEIWGNEDQALRRKRGWAIAAYVTLNTLTMIALAVCRKHYLS
jgi:hypothetical protein